MTVPEIADLLGESVSRVRRLIEDRQFIGVKRDGVFAVPELFFLDGEPLSALRGTIIVLSDVGFSDEEAVEWLLSVEDSVGDTPIAAIRAGRKTEIRRIAQALA
ncbi:putative transcriptional regulatory protein [Mycetocola reblochoni REB411]|uniref:Putative transcriptional regulatory protein n=1 Tax=Mycetocola reblochoni REB411 TaxID=1255698 RepID=A0A1R4J821_9MICO|nr:putative transcriptional regulatory protein [Mycetocola reblochoni REB411]